MNKQTCMLKAVQSSAEIHRGRNGHFIFSDNSLDHYQECLLQSAGGTLIEQKLIDWTNASRESKLS